MKPFLTIVCATFNSQDVIAQFLSSVRNQTAKNFELIIIDGGSTDKTLEIINGNIDIVSHFLSESDRGIYDAWNKGIKLANTSWLCFVGSDDLLKPDFIEIYYNAIKSLPNTGVEYICSRVNYFGENNTSIRILGEPWKWSRFRRAMVSAHVGSLHNIQLFMDVGLYNINYRIVGDYELLLRKGRFLQAAFVDLVTVDMKAGGVSLSVASLNERFKAHRCTAKLLFIEAAIYYVIGILSLVKIRLEISMNRWH